MTPIEQAAGIGPVLGGELRRAGVATLEELRALGRPEAWRRLHAVYPQRDCAHACLALGGAIEGVRWQELPAETRASVKAEAEALRSA
jgi:hypothetical protein